MTLEQKVQDKHYAVAEGTEIAIEYCHACEAYVRRVIKEGLVPIQPQTQDEDNKPSQRNVINV